MLEPRHHWDRLVRFLEDGRIELDTNIVERGMRPIATHAAGQHPRRHHDHHAGSRLDIDNTATVTLLATVNSDTPPIERVPTIMDLQPPPDMGRMTLKLRSIAKRALRRPRWGCGELGLPCFPHRDLQIAWPRSASLLRRGSRTTNRLAA